MSTQVQGTVGFDVEALRDLWDREEDVDPIRSGEIDFARTLIENVLLDTFRHL